MELSHDELRLVTDWLSWAEGEGARSSHSPEGMALSTRIQMELNPPAEPADVVVAFTQDEAEIVMEWWNDVDDWSELPVEEESILRKLDKARKGL